jgi:hypothetical protein
MSSRQAQATDEIDSSNAPWSTELPRCLDIPMRRREVLPSGQSAHCSEKAWPRPLD